MSHSQTIFPRHEPTQYEVTEHDVVTCPPDLWPLIREWHQRNVPEVI